MSDQKISDLDALTSVADGDEFVVVDKSDTSMSASGTNKRITKGNLLIDIAKILNPVGTIREFTVSTNPATLLGFGTWTEFGKGRVTVGRDAGQTEFDTVEETGGAKTHTLTQGEMPVHTHVQNAHSHSLPSGMVRYVGSGGNGQYPGGGINDIFGGEFSTNPATPTNQNAGSGQAHNNLQPYIVVYRWKRTA